MVYFDRSARKAVVYRKRRWWYIADRFIDIPPTSGGISPADLVVYRRHLVVYQVSSALKIRLTVKSRSKFGGAQNSAVFLYRLALYVVVVELQTMNVRFC